MPDIDSEPFPREIAQAIAIAFGVPLALVGLIAAVLLGWR